MADIKTEPAQVSLTGHAHSCIRDSAERVSRALYTHESIDVPGGVKAGFGGCGTRPRQRSNAWKSFSGDIQCCISKRNSSRKPDNHHIGFSFAQSIPRCRTEGECSRSLREKGGVAAGRGAWYARRQAGRAA